MKIFAKQTSLRDGEGRTTKCMYRNSHQPATNHRSQYAQDPLRALQTSQLLLCRHNFLESAKVVSATIKSFKLAARLQ